MPLTALTSVADFGLDVAFVRGSRVENWETLDLTATSVAARIDEHAIATGCGGDVMGHPLNAVEWLARALFERVSGSTRGTSSNGNEGIEAR